MHALSRRERQKQELRERILDTTRDLLIEQGLEWFSMRKLAAKIDYTPTAIYFHFPDKESLLLELIASDSLAFRAALGQMPTELPPAAETASDGSRLYCFCDGSSTTLSVVVHDTWLAIIEATPER